MPLSTASGSGHDQRTRAKLHQNPASEPVRRDLRRYAVGRPAYLDQAARAIATQAWTNITDAGLEQVCFGWAGPIQRGAGHYYTLSGPSLLIEYDNTQDQANHIHSVWRDLRRDFAGDLLANHYAGVPH